jgi:ParB-like chromosome segregation protein Spo0J
MRIPQMEDKVVDKIIESNDLDQFKFFDNNRNIFTPQVAKLVESMRQNGFLRTNPITVNKDKYVIDGQHR